MTKPIPPRIHWPSLTIAFFNYAFQRKTVREWTKTRRMMKALAVKTTADHLLEIGFSSV